MTRREALLALGATLLAACFSDRTPTENGNGDGVVIDMTPNLVFEPATVTIEVGESVTWRNTSSFGHTATCDPARAADPSNVTLPEGAEAWDSGFMGPDDEFTHTFDVPGEYHYICEPHEPQEMFGTVVVVSP